LIPLFILRAESRQTRIAPSGLLESVGKTGRGFFIICARPPAVDGRSVPETARPLSGHGPSPWGPTRNLRPGHARFASWPDRAPFIRIYLENRRPCESVFMPCGDAGAMRNCVQNDTLEAWATYSPHPLAASRLRVALRRRPSASRRQRRAFGLTRLRVWPKLGGCGGIIPPLFCA